MKKIRFFLIFLLTLALIATPVLAADNNPEGKTLSALAAGETMEFNNGTIQVNNGTVTNNWGTIESNQGTVKHNEKTINTNTTSGTVGTNNSVVTLNQGTVTDNNGTINNAKDAIVNSNYSLVQNHGDVKNNMQGGTVYNFAGGTVEANALGIVYNLGGTVADNFGTVYNCGGTVTLSTSTVYQYHKLTLTVQGLDGKPVTNYTLCGASEGDLIENGGEIWLKEGGALLLTPTDGYIRSNEQGMPKGTDCKIEWVYPTDTKISEVADGATATVLLMKMATVTPSAVTYDRYAPTEVTMDKWDGEMTFAKISLSFSGVKYRYLEENVDYTVTGDIALTPALLTSLPVGSGTLHIAFSNANLPSLVARGVTLTVTDSAPDRAVTATQSEGGTVSMDKNAAKVGDTVTVTAVPEDGYRLKAILVDGTAIEGTSFVMKDQNAVVTVEFEAVPQETTAAQETTKGVATGDSQNLLLYAGIAAAAVLVFVGVLFATKKKKQ